ncbi:MAG: hypothetical protein PHU80_06415, partial [Kiritimatiellae bacterium]|nr:hypothetical protein [Kiritimatiellia bacterium]
MSDFDHDLNRINGKINRWRTFEHFIFVLAAFLSAWIFMTALDVWLRPRFFTRVAMASILPVLALAALAWLVKVFNHKRNPAAVAAFLENKFPQLDNHLINHVLFSDEGSSSPWLKTYLREGVPGFAALPLAEIKNSQLRRRGGLAVLAALLVLAVPAFLLGNAWTVSMRRVVNPFSKLAPPTFAKVHAVLPENTTIVQGDGVNLTVKASGRAGQFVDIDIFPADDRRSTIRAGQFKNTGKEEEFTYRVSKIASSLEYRFKVGDAYPTDKYTVDTVPPLALTTLRLTVTPPGYTALLPQSFEALTNAIAIPVHSTAAFHVFCNRPVVKAELVLEQDRLSLNPSQDRVAWTGTSVIDQGGTFQIVARDSFGLEMRVPFNYKLLEDSAPAIRLIAPAGNKATLTPNAIPVVQFEAADEYGLGAVRLERVPKGAKPSAEGEVLKEWDAGGQKRFSEKWVGALEDIPSSAALRIVVYDNADAGGPNRAVSQLIQFEAAPMASIMADANEKRGSARKTLAELIARQRAVLAVTSRLSAELPTFDGQPWSEAALSQSEIRKFAGDLLKSRDAAIGAARVSLERALKEPLPEAVIRLTRILSGASETREDNAQAAVKAQNDVLRMLVQADESMNKGEVSQAAAGVLAMLEGIRKGQTANLNVTLKSAQSGAG